MKSLDKKIQDHFWGFIPMEERVVEEITIVLVIIILIDIHQEKNHVVIVWRFPGKMVKKVRKESNMNQ